MYTDPQLADLGFYRKGVERHLIIGPYYNKLAWPDQITGNSRRPRLIIRGRMLFFVPVTVWREMNRYSYGSDEKSHYFRTMWTQCSRMELPLQPHYDIKKYNEKTGYRIDSYLTLTELVLMVKNGQWIEKDFYGNLPDPAPAPIDQE